MFVQTLVLKTFAHDGNYLSFPEKLSEESKNEICRSAMFDRLNPIAYGDQNLSLPDNVWVRCRRKTSAVSHLACFCPYKLSALIFDLPYAATVRGARANCIRVMTPGASGVCVILN